jgi:hypothetical protein
MARCGALDDLDLLEAQGCNTRLRNAVTYCVSPTTVIFVSVRNFL